MIRGERVRVERPVDTGETTPGGNAVVEWVGEDVDDVLVAPGPRNDLVESTRPDGVRIAWTLHFPKGYPATLRGARISVRGQDPCRVVGDPQHYTEANTPGRWSMPVELAGREG